MICSRGRADWCGRRRGGAGAGREEKEGASRAASHGSWRPCSWPGRCHPRGGGVARRRPAKRLLRDLSRPCPGGSGEGAAAASPAAEMGSLREEDEESRPARPPAGLQPAVGVSAALEGTPEAAAPIRGRGVAAGAQRTCKQRLPPASFSCRPSPADRLILRKFSRFTGG